MPRSAHCLCTVAVAGCLVAAAPVAAQVYRCERDGVVRYTDQPCDGQARPADLPELVVVPAEPAPDLVREGEKRREAGRAARDKADAEWVEAYAARKAAEEQLRSARVTGTVVEGMTPADVRRIHGEPAVVSNSRSGKGARETWSYVLGDGRRLHVTFIDGRVSAVRSREEKK